MKIRTMMVTATAAITAIALSAPANAVAIACNGNLSGAYTTKDGSVVIKGSWHPSWTQICNLNTEWNEVPAQTCWAWFSQVNAAVAQSKNVRIYYNVAANMTCNQLPTYGASPEPYYVMLMDP